MASKKKTENPTVTDVIKSVEHEALGHVEEVPAVAPIERKRTPSKKAVQEHPPISDTRRICAVCGIKSDKMFARVGNEWVCCPACLSRYGKTR